MPPIGFFWTSVPQQLAGCHPRGETARKWTFDDEATLPRPLPRKLAHRYLAQRAFPGNTSVGVLALSLQARIPVAPALCKKSIHLLAHDIRIDDRLGDVVVTASRQSLLLIASHCLGR